MNTSLKFISNNAIIFKSPLRCREKFMRILLGIIWGFAFYFAGIIIFGVASGMFGINIIEKESLLMKAFVAIFIISWIIVVPMAFFGKLPGTARKKKCSFCKELILRDALVCRFCKSHLSNFSSESFGDDKKSFKKDQEVVCEKNT